MGFENCHRLDLVMDAQKPHLTWVQDMLGLYRSAIIYSNATYKVITERRDLPLRQVFHAGNTIPGRTEIRMGGDPARPNQITADFLDRNLNYQRNPKYVQDMTSVVSDADPITDQSLSYVGLTRESEVLRSASLELQRRRSMRREISWATGLEGLAVEPGDVAAVGVVTTNWEMGFGGRALDGSSRHLVADREVTVTSGYTYELLVWHTAADTPETRTVATSVPAGQSSFTTITVSPTSGFNSQILPGDRWAVGITSEDLIRVRVTKVTRAEDGAHVLTGEEFLPFDFYLDCPGSVTTAVSNAPPSQPSTASIAVSGCTLCANVVTVPGCVGGLLTVPGTLGSVTLNSSHNPNVAALVGDTLRFTTGPASGATTTVSAWGGSGSNVATVSNAFSASSVPASGNSYYVTHRVPPFGGLEIEVDSGGGFVLHGAVNATSGCVDIENTADALGVRITPFSDRGQRNAVGRWTASVAAAGCRDPAAPYTDPATITGSAESVFFAARVAANALGNNGRIDAEISALVTEACSPATERTDVFLSLRLGAQTLISSLAVRLGDTGAYGTQHEYGQGNYGGLTVAGSDLAALVSARVVADNASNRQLATLRYRGPGEVEQLDVSRQGTGTVDMTVANTLAVLAQFSHLDSASAVHSHGCFFLVFRNAVTEITEI